MEEREDIIEEEDEDVYTEAVESQAETIEDDTEPETETAAEPTVTSKYTGPGAVHSKPPEAGARSFLPNSTYVIDSSDPSPNITASSIKISEEKTKNRTRSQQQPVQKEERASSQQHHNSSRNVRFEEDSDEGSPVTTFKKTPFKNRSTSSLAEKVTAQSELDDSIENVKKLPKPKPILRKSASMTQLDEAKPIAGKF